MKKILVPIDFSPAARFGLEYAEWLSLRYLNEIIAVHVATPPNYEETLSEAHIAKFKTQKKEAIETHLKRFATSYPDHDKEALSGVKNIHCQTRFGETVEEILKCGEEEKVDLIVIGTRNKHSMWEHLFGSVTTQLLSKSGIPILVIPEGTSIQEIKKIAFATAITGAEASTLAYLEKLTKFFGAELLQVFVNMMPYDFFDNKEEVWKLPHSLMENQSFHMVRDPNVVQGIDYFIHEYNIDLLAMMVPKRNKVEQFFHQSKTKKMAYKTAIPLLIIPT